MKFLKTMVYELGVQFEDIDAGGYVHHPNYLKFAERGRYQSLRDVSFGFERQLQEGFIFVVAEMQLKYLKPLMMGDRVYVLTRLVASRRSSVKVYQTIVKDCPSAEKLDAIGDQIFALPSVFQAQMRFVYFDLKKPHPMELPDEVKHLLEIPGRDYFKQNQDRQDVSLSGFSRA